MNTEFVVDGSYELTLLRGSYVVMVRLVEPGDPAELTVDDGEHVFTKTAGELPSYFGMMLDEMKRVVFSSTAPILVRLRGVSNDGSSVLNVSESQGDSR